MRINVRCVRGSSRTTSWPETLDTKHVFPSGGNFVPKGWCEIAVRSSPVFPSTSICFLRFGDLDAPDPGVEGSRDPRRDDMKLVKQRISIGNATQTKKIECYFFLDHLKAKQTPVLGESRARKRGSGSNFAPDVWCEIAPTQEIQAPPPEFRARFLARKSSQRTICWGISRVGLLPPSMSGWGPSRSQQAWIRIRDGSAGRGDHGSDGRARVIPWAGY